MIVIWQKLHGSQELAPEVFDPTDLGALVAIQYLEMLFEYSLDFLRFLGFDKGLTLISHLFNLVTKLLDSFGPLLTLDYFLLISNKPVNEIHYSLHVDL